jgi:hypothetical protein
MESLGSNPYEKQRIPTTSSSSATTVMTTTDGVGGGGGISSTTTGGGGNDNLRHCTCQLKESIHTHIHLSSTNSAWEASAQRLQWK